MDSEAVKQLSSSLFQRVKPFCAELSLLASAPDWDESSAVHCLRQISIELSNHHQTDGAYILSTKLADYIFFPLSSLLKRPSLPCEATQYILQVVAFLIEHSWSFDIQEAFLDQLFPLVVFLTASQKGTAPLEFYSASTACYVATLKCVPRNYYSDSRDATQTKRLSVLVDATTDLLSMLDLYSSQFESEARAIFSTLTWLYSTRVSAEQASYVLPGMISKTANFYSSAKNLPSSLLVEVLGMLKALVVKVFGDESLDVSLTMESVPSDFETLLQNLNAPIAQASELASVKIGSKDGGQHRTTAWLNATSKQLKLTILVIMKGILLNANSQVKLRTNAKLCDAVFDFVSDIVKSCFKSLFNELVPSTIDILAALHHVICGPDGSMAEERFLGKVEMIYTVFPRSELNILHKLLVMKTMNLVTQQLPRIMLSSDDEKISLCFSALKIHLHLVKALKTVQQDSDELNNTIKTLLKTISQSLAGLLASGSSKKATMGNKDELLARLSGNSAESKTNTLDDIELPPHIDATRLGKIDKEHTQAAATHVSSLKRLDVDLETLENSLSVARFDQFYSKESEAVLREFVEFVGRLNQSNMEELLGYILEPSNESSKLENLSHSSIALWISNGVYREGGAQESFNMDEFLDLGDAVDSSNDEESSYLLLQGAQDIMNETKAISQEHSYAPGSPEHRVCELSYTTALETIGILAGRLSKEDFQTDVLMDYLLPLFEALTYTPDSRIHLQAKLSLRNIVQAHYGGSLERLIAENSDYLVDSLSMSLSVASGLTPSLPGILLVVLKVSGQELLLSNQLQDIISEIFIVIDSYHGYSTLVENFFHVFEEVVVKTKQSFWKELSDSFKLQETIDNAFKPWGLSNTEDALKLILDSHKRVDPFANYEPEKQYFKNPGVPFSDLTPNDEGDSDDEEENEEEEPEKSEVWPSPLPKNVYTTIQQIFTYGLQLLSHPSGKLKHQILQTLKKAYPLMATNYKVLMPILAQYWPLLLVMSAGTTSTSEYATPGNDQLVGPTLELLIIIIEEDNKHERFMSSRFIDLWEFMKKKSATAEAILSRSSAVAVKTPSSNLWSRLLIKGISIYGRSVPDLVAHDMMKVCMALGIPGDEPLGKDIQNHLWVLRNYST